MNAAIKWGAIVGVAVYLAVLACYGLSNVLVAQAGPHAAVTEHPILLLPLCLELFVLVFAFSAAGFYTGRETGKAELGAVAGIVTLVVQYVVGLIGDALTGIGTGAGSSAAAPAVNPIAQVLVTLVSAGLALALAASIGWLGGRPGAARSPRRRVAAASVTLSADPAPSQTSVRDGTGE